MTRNKKYMNTKTTPTFQFIQSLDKKNHTNTLVKAEKSTTLKRIVTSTLEVLTNSLLFVSFDIPHKRETSVNISLMKDWRFLLNYHSVARARMGWTRSWQEKVRDSTFGSYSDFLAEPFFFFPFFSGIVFTS
jgi:hypothetical protein